MQIKKTIFINALFAGVMFFLSMVSAQAAQPLWTITPVGGSSPTQIIPDNGTATIQYLVQNQSGRAKRLVMQPIQGISQPAFCSLAPKGQPGSSCVISLTITGSSLPANGIHQGPALCQANPDGKPNPNQCYQPSAANSLNLSRGPAVGAVITVSPGSLSFVEGSNAFVTVTNTPTSIQPATNILATIPGGSNISVQNTTCGATLAIGASCTITFTAPAPEGPTNITISGDNTNAVNLPITVTQLMAILSVNPTTLLFAENSTGDVTVTNDVSSPVAANNVAATIPGGSNISVQSSTCGATLAIGASCTITFASSSQEGPTTIPIAADNSNTVNVDVTVTSQPQISITSPVLQNRVITVGGAALNLQITNDAGSSVNATAITVSNQASCPNLVVNDTLCTSVAPGNSCILELTSNTPYVPCTITISGSNTANSPTTFVAFFHLGGLVFEASGGTGKVVQDFPQEDDAQWSDSFSPIPNADDLNNGISNTNAIVADASCTSDPSNCAAQLCRDISASWYLPAENEMLAVYFALCPNGAIPCNFGGFQQTPYWTSSQNIPSPTLFAQIINFPAGSAAGFGKTSPNFFRCTRTF